MSHCQQRQLDYDPLITHIEHEVPDSAMHLSVL